MGYLLAPLRLLGMVVMLLSGLLIASVVFPWQRQSARNRIIRRWSALLMRVCGVRVRTVNAGASLPPALAATGMRPGGPGRLLLINHISWIDIFGINAAMPARFVAKAEIGAWPVMGTLVTLAGTLYIERGRRHAVHAMNVKVREKLAAGESVAVFAEGTTTDGATLLPFHSNLIAPAVEAGCEVWPVALRYTQRGVPSQAAAFIGEMTLVESMWRIVSAWGLELEVAFLPPVATAAADGQPAPTRHQIAQAARASIGAHLGVAVDAASMAGGAAPNADASASTSHDPAAGG
ncbi:MAG: 1-acyl-sn-glycerol-3-phosphate acyltransferase [Burkholderiaceae bacterium]|nr:1-acyl-sn-glycerol-3-phosphate acyltransferase [Burkholderiaceae bacterium]